MVTKEEIIKNLKDDGIGLSIQDLANMNNSDRVPISIILAELIGEKNVEVKWRGNLKLHFWAGEK